MRSIAQSQGSLPKELQECQEYIESVAVWLDGVRRSISVAKADEENQDQFIKNGSAVVERGTQVLIHPIDITIGKEVGSSLEAKFTTIEDDRHLEEAIQQCSRTSIGLLALLESFSGDFQPDEALPIVQRTRKAFRSVKRAGKIMWKRDRITEIRDKLFIDRNNVHIHISSRTGRQVMELLYATSFFILEL